MSLRVVERASSTTLVEEANLTTNFFTGTESYDSAKIAVATEAVGDAFSQYLGFPLWRERVVETLDRWQGSHRHGPRMYLLRRPIETVHSVTTSSGTVDAADYTVQGTERDHLRHDSNWSGVETEVDYTAGFYMPDQVPVWQSGKAYAEDDLVRDASRRIFQATVAGTSDPDDEPAWPDDPDQTVSDGGVTWQQLDEGRLIPSEIETAAAVSVGEFLRGSLSVSGLARDSEGGALEVRSQFRGGLPFFARRILNRYRG